MSKFLRLTAALLGLLAVPAFAQTPSPAAPSTPVVPRSAPAAPSTPVVPRVAPVTPPTAAAPRAAPAAAPTAATPAASAKRVNINTAAPPQLETLPGIGPARAAAIVAGRPYADLIDLVTKKVLTQGVFDGVKDRLALVNINTSTASEMEKTLKGIGDARSKAVVSGRPYATPQDLVTKKILTQGVYDGLKDAITY